MIGLQNTGTLFPLTDEAQVVQIYCSIFTEHSEQFYSNIVLVAIGVTQFKV